MEYYVNAILIKDFNGKFKYIYYFCPDTEVLHKKTLNQGYQITYLAYCPKCKQDQLVID